MEGISKLKHVQVCSNEKNRIVFFYIYFKLLGFFYSEVYV